MFTPSGYTDIRIRKFEFVAKTQYFCLAYVTLQAPIGSLNKFQPIRSSRLPSYTVQPFAQLWLTYI